MMILGLLAILGVGAIAMSVGGDDSETETPEAAEEMPVEEESVPEEEGPPGSFSALLSATDSSGDAIPDASMLSDGPVDGENADRTFVITPPMDGNAAIDIAYDPETTFLVDLNAGVLSLDIGLNTDVAGAGATGTATSVDDVLIDGVTVLQTTQAQVYNASTNITLHVCQEDIGEHVAQIDLSNPLDQLNFAFGPDVTGNLHLITNEVELPGAEGSTTQSTVYVIQTAAEVTSLSASEIDQILAQDGSAQGGTQLLAEIYLGEESVNADGNQITISDGMNETPAFTTNIAWASEGQHDGTPSPDVPAVPDLSTPDVPAPDTPAPVDVPTTTPTAPADPATPSTPIVAPDENPLVTDLTDPDFNIPGLDPADLADLTPAEIQELEDLIDQLGGPDVLDLTDIPDISDVPDLGGIPSFPLFPGFPI